MSTGVSDNKVADRAPTDKPRKLIICHLDLFDDRLFDQRRKVEVCKQMVLKSLEMSSAHDETMTKKCDQLFGKRRLWQKLEDFRLVIPCPLGNIL